MAFEADLERNLFTIQRRLQSGAWRHGSYQPFMVHDPKLRRIHKASVADRVVHQALFRQLEPIFEPTFAPCAWSCRKGKGVAAAIDHVHKKLEKLSRYGTREVIVLQCDIKSFFASVDHDALLGLLEARIVDSRVMAILRNIVESHAPGMPLGNVTSQLFANIVLTPLDRFVLEKCQQSVYARYCDDLLIAGTDIGSLLARTAPIGTFLHDTLKLALHPKKTTLRRYCSGIDWLGVRLLPGGRRRMRAVTRRRAWRRIAATVHGVMDGAVGDEEWRAIAASYRGVFERGHARGDATMLDVLREIM